MILCKKNEKMRKMRGKPQRICIQTEPALSEAEWDNRIIWIQISVNRRSSAAPAIDY